MVPPPAQILVIGDELALSWKDGSESYLKLRDVRRLCPCAGCAGERDLFGRLAKPPQKPYTPASFEVAATTPVGGHLWIVEFAVPPPPDAVREFAAAIDALISERTAGAREVALEEVDARAPPDKIRDGVARLMSPYL